MREFAFSVEFAPGAHRVGDLFLEHEDLRLRLVECAIASDRAWRLDHLTGPPAVLDEALAVLTDDDCNDCLGTRTCAGGHDYQPMEVDDGRLLYTDRPLPRACHSVPRMVAEHLGEGVFAAADHHGGRVEWRLLLPDESGVGQLYDALPAHLRDGIDFRFQHLRDPEGWPVGTALPPEQRAAVEAAVEKGFYETPRRTTVTELAEALDLPRSTLSYRLRRAEARMAKALIHADGAPASR